MNDSVAQRSDHGARAVRGTKFLKQVLEAGFHGVLTEAKILRNFLVAPALDQKFEYGNLPQGEFMTGKL